MKMNKNVNKKLATQGKKKAGLSIFHPDNSHQIKRLNKIAGQVNGIKKMIDDKRYCMDVLIQTKAVCSAIKSLEASILESHLQSCVKAAFVSKDKNESTKKIDELMNVFKKSF